MSAVGEGVRSRALTVKELLTARYTYGKDYLSAIWLHACGTSALLGDIIIRHQANNGKNALYFTFRYIKPLRRIKCVAWGKYSFWSGACHWMVDYVSELGKSSRGYNDPDAIPLIKMYEKKFFDIFFLPNSAFSDADPVLFGVPMPGKEECAPRNLWHMGDKTDANYVERSGTNDEGRPQITMVTTHMQGQRAAFLWQLDPGQFFSWTAVEQSAALYAVLARICSHVTARCVELEARITAIGHSLSRVCTVQDDLAVVDRVLKNNCTSEKCENAVAEGCAKTHLITMCVTTRGIDVYY